MTPASNRQVPDHSIMDLFGKQAYLGNQFLSGSGVVALADAAEHPVLSIACPDQATQGVGAFPNTKALFINLRQMFCNDATGLTGIVYRVYVNATTLAAGTVKVPVNARPANSLTSIAVVRASPTAAGNGTLAGTYSVGFGICQELDALLILDAGQNMLITAQGTAASSAIVDASWYEL